MWFLNNLIVLKLGWRYKICKFFQLHCFLSSSITNLSQEQHLTSPARHQLLQYQTPPKLVNVNHGFHPRNTQTLHPPPHRQHAALAPHHHGSYNTKALSSRHSRAVGRRVLCSACDFWWLVDFGRDDAFCYGLSSLPYVPEEVERGRDGKREFREELIVKRQEICMVSRECIHQSTSAAGKSSRKRCMQRVRIWLVSFGTYVSFPSVLWTSMRSRV